MKHLIIVISLFLLLSKNLLVHASTYTYSLDDSIIPNPERGFYSGDSIHPGDTFSTNASSLGNTLVHVNYYLDSFINSPISQQMLTTITDSLNAARAKHLKIIPRFMYNDGDTYPAGCPDASESRIHEHLLQLKPILEAGSDVIAGLDAGFVGCWAEWHNPEDKNGLLSISAKTRILIDILDNFPANRQVLMRYPPDLITILPTLSNAQKNRVGHHNDCFLASSSDMGTYKNPTAEKDFLSTLGNNSIIGGETCAVSSRSTCTTAMVELQQMHYSHLNEEYHPGVLQSWKDGGCFNTIKKNLGYRLRLNNITFPNQISPGQTVNFQASLTNLGFASPYNQRPVYLVLYNQTNKYPLLLSEDPRSWKASTTTTINQTISLPTQIASGTYSLALWLPDKASNLQSIPAYSIRLANQNTWDPNNGYNILTQNITVTSATATPKPGDLNGDGQVNIFDFNILISKFGNPYTVFDFNTLLSNYSK